MLIQKGSFDRGGPALQFGAQIGLVEVIAQRFGPDARQQRVRICGGGVQKIHRPKSSSVIKGHAHAVFHIEDHMVVLFRGWMVLHKGPQHLPRNQHSARHAQMHQQGFAR